MNSFSLVFFVCIYKLSKSIFITKYRSNYPIILDEDKIIKGIDIHFSKYNLSMIRAYYGIRYASVGKLKPGTAPEYRFQQSVASFYYEDFSGTRQLEDFKPVCPQNLVNFSHFDYNTLNSYWMHVKMIQPFLKDQNEECLTLNIYVPKKNYHTQNQFAVLIFVHGEDFRTGTGNVYDMSVLSSYGDIICVTINYRLGILGFLNMANGDIDGNFALYDLFAAILWVKGHIKHFNGDPENISLMGYGDGAVFIHFFTKSKLFQNKNLISIRRLILLNGIGLPFFNNHPSSSFDEEILKLFNQTRKSLLSYLKSTNSSEILAAQQKLKSNKLIDKLAPMFSSQLFNFNEQKMTNDYKLLDIDLWVGVMRNNAGKYFNKVETMTKSEMTEEQFRVLLKNFVEELQLCDSKILSGIVEHFYTNWSVDSMTSSQYAQSDMRITNFNKLLNDAFFIAPAIKMVNDHSRLQNRQSTFFHFFDIPPYQANNLLVSEADFLDDLALFFGAPLAYPENLDPFNKKDANSLLNISMLMMSQLSAFIKSGNPNFVEKAASQLKRFSWPNYSHSTKHFVHYHSQRTIPKVSISSNLMPDIAQFWNEFIPQTCLSFKSSNITQPVPKDPPIKLVIRYIDVPNEHSLTTYSSGEIKQFSESSTIPRDFSDKFILILTIIIGSSLLILNVLIFLGIFYQARKIRTMNLNISRQKSQNAIGDIQRNIFVNNNHVAFGHQESIPLSIKNNNHCELLDIFQ